MNLKKLIILIISILITVVGTFLLGLYDYKVWLDPNGRNATKMTSEYRSYLVNELIDFKNNETPIQNTKDKIDLSRALSNYKYSKTPIYHNENDVFTIDIYQNQFWYVNSDLEQELDHYRYEVFIYNVNYDLLKSKFKSQSVPSNDTVEKAQYPYFIINFYPNNEFNESEVMMSPKKDSGGNEIDTTAPIVLHDGTKVIGQKFNSSNSLALFDYSSNPTKDTNGDVFYVNFLVFYDYSVFVGNNTNLYNDNRDLFTDGGYIKIDSILEIEDKGEKINYTLKDSLLTDYIDDFTFDRNKLKNKELIDGFTTSSNSGQMFRNIKIEGVKTYDQWIIGRYLWWHCLCCFIVLGVVMTGFYFIFSYEEKGKSRKKGHKK